MAHKEPAWLAGPLSKRMNMHFKPTLIPTLAAIIVIGLMMKLGFWQLHRAQEKETIQQASELFRAHLAQHPLTFAELLQQFPKINPAANDSHLHVSGHFLPTKIILHDNRMNEGQAGYHVLTVFQPNDSRVALLVNSGWHSWPNGDRKNRPIVQLPTTEQQLNGTVHIPVKGVFTLAKNTDLIEPHFVLVETLELDHLSQLLQHPLAPFVLRLDADTPALQQTNLQRHWLKADEIGMTAEKHRGYAFQWFIMAAVVFGLYLKLNLKKHP